MLLKGMMAPYERRHTVASSQNMVWGGFWC